MLFATTPTPRTAAASSGSLRAGHQWDYPNAWAPLVHMLVEGCAGFGGAEGGALAADVVGARAGARKTRTPQLYSCD